MEILIAAVLLAVMTTLLMGAFRVAASTWSKGERKAEQVNRMLVVSNFLRSQIGGAMAIKEPLDPTRQQAPVQTGQQPLNPQKQVIFYGSNQGLRYVGAIPAQVHGGIYQFEMYLSGGSASDEGQDLRVAICPLRPADRAMPKPQPPCLDQENKIDDVALVEDVESVSISYFRMPSPAGGMGTPGVPTVADYWDGQGMPAYVRIDIAPQGEEPWPTISVEPRADASQ